MSWLPYSTYKKLKQADRLWEQQPKKEGFMPLKQYIAKKKQIAEQQTIYISEDHIGRIEEAPVFYRKMNDHIYKRYSQKGTTSFVRHIPRKMIPVTANKQWWEAKFGEPL